MGKKVIIDCDAGVDDALALILACHSPELEVEAVTAVSGNVPMNLGFENIQRVLSLIRPVRRSLIAKGADRPLKGNPVYAFSFHGQTGLGRSRLDHGKGESCWQIFPGPADELITRMARLHPNEMTLIAIGPLTNLALGLQKDPEGMKKLKDIVIMGGAVRVKGNVTPHAEFNIFVDPLAAKIVFESGLPITLVPLDVTHQVCLTSKEMEERVGRLSNLFGQFVFEATQYDAQAQRFVLGREAFPLHDPLAVASVIHRDLVGTERLCLDVETRDEECCGQTKEAEGGVQSDVCLRVKSQEFLELFLSRFSSPR